MFKIGDIITYRRSEKVKPFEEWIGWDMEVVDVTGPGLSLAYYVVITKLSSTDPNYGPWRVYPEEMTLAGPADIKDYL